MLPDFHIRFLPTYYRTPAKIIMLYQNYDQMFLFNFLSHLLPSSFDNLPSKAFPRAIDILSVPMTIKLIYRQSILSII